MTVGDPGDPPSSSSPQSPSLEPATNGQPAPAPTPGLAAHSDQELLDNFPVAKLTKLDELISNPRWVIPVLPGGELEVLLEYCIELCKRKLDTQSEHCQRFFREGLTISFQKIMTDEAVSSWRFDIHKCILKNCERLLGLVCTKISEDWFPLLELLALVFNPNNKFHVYNSSRASESPQSGSEEVHVYAASIDTRQPKGWLVDLLNVFGGQEGFQLIHDRIMSGNNLTVPLIFALVRPFGLCYELLTLKTVKQYFLPIIEAVPKFLENLTDEELKKESKNESKNDTISAIVKSLKSLLSLVPGQEEDIKTLEMFRLKMLLRQLQISSFSGKMSALNEVNKVISGVIYTPQRHTVSLPANNTGEDEDWLTADRMAAWIKENRVIKIVLRDNLHQPQYVEKLEKMIRFVIKEKALSLSDLDDIWSAQDGKHEAIVKNVHDLLAKLAWDFSPEQLDHLFECFQDSWRAAAVARQREKLLELIRRLAEDDKDGVMADKVLKLFWTLAQSVEASTEIMDQALAAHVKILDYSCTQYREQQKSRWLDKCVEELKTNDKWVLPALKQIKEICSLYQEQPANGMHGHGQRTAAVVYRSEVINRLQQSHALVIQIADNLTNYMASIRAGGQVVAAMDPNEFSPDGRYSHTAQVSERLNFLRFLLRDGQLWLCAPQAKQIWHCLAEDAIFASDREICFKWFSKLMGDEPDLDPEINKDFFESNLLKLDPALLTEAGMKCFERFFKAVNCKEGKLILKRRATLMDDLELIGLDYIWKVVLCSSDAVSSKAIDLLKETFTNLGPRLLSQQVEIHEDFISSCMDRLKASFDTVSVLQAGDGGNKAGQDKSRMEVEVLRLCRVLTVLHEYVSECDAEYQEERSCIPLYRAARGKQLALSVRFPNSGHKVEDMEFWVHDNDTLASLRRQIFQKLKASPMNIKLELFVGQEILDVVDDRKILALLPIKDKCMITAKLSQTGAGAGASSPDSSSESSGGSPQHHMYEGPNIETEQCLPGVLMSTRQNHALFLTQLAELGVSLASDQLRASSWQLLRLMPADLATIARIQSTAAAAAKTRSTTGQDQLEQLFMSSSNSLTLYQLECCLSLVMPAGPGGPMSEKAFEFQQQLVRAGGVGLVLNMLTNQNFLKNADIITKKSAYLTLLKLSKFLLAVAGHSLFFLVVESQQPSSSTKVSDSTHNHAVMLQQALQAGIPCPGEVNIRQAVTRLGQHLLEAGSHTLPSLEVVRSVLRLAWCSSAADLNITDLDTLKQIHKTNKEITIDPDYAKLAREALEVLTVSVALCPSALETLSKDKSWHSFLVDLVLLCPEVSVRQTAADQFLLMTSRASSDTTQVKMMVTLLFTVINSLAEEFADQSAEYFLLLTRLLAYLSTNGVVLNNSGALLSRETEILAAVRQSVLTTGTTGVCNMTLEGHLNITRELVMFLTPDRKLEIGIGNAGNNTTGLIKELVEDWIFPASKLWVMYATSGDISGDNAVIHPVCQTQAITAAAFDLLVALTTNCPGNLAQLAAMLTEMFYSGDELLTEWEFLPPVGPRPSGGFVGLKNAGATCYMNSVLQQLFMLSGIKEGVLGCDQAATDPDEDFSGEDKLELDENEEEDKGDYNLTILKQVQAIFGHLSSTQLQYYIPRGLWRHFRMLGEPVNLREQQDAVEFFMTLIDTIDEALKSVGHEQICSKVLGGVISDQKICKPCPHRYSRQEPCSVIPVDVKNYSNLMDSLAEYTKGELLETENAYYCERCDKKVDTVKRLCVKKLPPILVIQLKRFDYDFERDAAVKFNDYFEFPRELDMEPYTVAGMAKRENEAVDCEPEDLDPNIVRKYKLRGMVVHSGQASGGHYYSYIKHGDRWYKFDDGDVTEVNMEDDEELKTQCWGGEYMSEVFDHMLKRMSYRRQKRWWNAYMLFYCRSDLEPAVSEAELIKSVDNLKLSETSENDKPSDNDLNTNAGTLEMPKPIRKSILKQNVKFLHNRNQFSVEYFTFMRKLIQCNAPFVTVAHGEKLSKDGEEISLTTVQLASAFLFSVGFHTKKSLRGNATDWYEILSQHLRCSPASRAWFANNVLFSQPGRFSEYLLECPSPEVRQAVSKLIVFTAHFASSDPASPIPACLSNIPVEIAPVSGLSDHLLLAVLALLWVEVSEHGRHLSQYFSLFAIYANLGSAEKTQLLKLNVPSLFISVSLDDGPGPPIKYQYAELGKLYQVVSTLVRCCDISSLATSSHEGQAPLANPYMDPSLNHNYIMPIQAPVSDLLFNRYGYLKKLIEEANQGEDTRRLLQFCCWENPQFSHMVLYELLWQIAFAYTYELRPYLDLLLYMLCIEDSWQTHRIHKALKGIPDDHSSRDGLFETIQRSKNHYQKRAYQCIKMLVSLFSQCGAARNIMESAGDLKRRWTWSVEWLHDELERGGAGPGHRAPYASTAGSNETANGYFLERSHSARLTLEKACELLPDDDNEAEGAAGDAGGDSGPPEAERPKQGGQEGGRRTGGSITSGQPIAGITSPTQGGPGQPGNKQRMRRRDDDDTKDKNHE